MKTGRRKKCVCRFDYRAGVALPVPVTPRSVPSGR